MFSTGYITASDGKTYEWGVRHYMKIHRYTIGGRIEWVAIADENGLVARVDLYSRWPEPGIVRNIVDALIERFEWEGEEYEKSIRKDACRTSNDVGLCVFLHGFDGSNRG